MESERGGWAIGSEDWRERKIGDCIELIYGKGLPVRQRKKGNIPVFGSNGIVGYHDEPIVKAPGIIIGRKGSVGEITFSKQDFWPIDTTYYLKTKQGYDISFWYYFLKTLGLNQMNTHSAVPGLNRDGVYEIVRAIPDFMQQHAIASILSSLDDKIEVNRQMNTILEAIGQALFKHWFVDFEFPNEEGKPYKSSGGEMVETELGEVPVGWKVGTIDDGTSLIIDYRGKTPKKLGSDWSQRGIPAISAKNIKAGRIVQRKMMKFVDEELFNVWMKDKLELGDILLTSEAPLGELLYLATNINFCLSQRVFALRANNDSCLPIYLYYWLNTDLAQERLHSRATGTTVVGVRQSELRKVEVLIPPKSIQIKSAKILENCMLKISNNEDENNNLGAIRDALLPKLMSGKIRVK